MPFPWWLFPLAPVPHELIQAPTPLLSWTVSAAFSPCFLSLSFKSILEQGHQHGLPKPQLQSATVHHSLLPAFLSLECHTSEPSCPPFLGLSFFRIMSSVLCSNQASGCHPTFPKLPLLLTLPPPPPMHALSVTSSRGNALLDINTQFKCCLPSETFPNPFNQI